MKINLADYSPDYGKTLVLKRGRIYKVGFLVIFLFNLCVSFSFLIWTWGHFNLLFFVYVYAFLSSFLFVYLGFLDCSNPMIGALSIDQSGLTIYPILGTPKTTIWNHIKKIKLRCWLGFSYIDIKTFERSYYFNMTSYAVNIKDFTELLTQWHQHYEALSENTRMEQKAD